MNGDCRVYLERKGLRPTRRLTGGPVLAPAQNGALGRPLTLTPEQQLALGGLGSPDAAGATQTWPDEEAYIGGQAR